ncbi:hypothetical protein [Pseudomonas sp. MF4836]|uniref:hypothetical protein n=1 Tax=Pseudomonas sp. MF4836 TaxID=1960827 RepID=UPI0012907BDC|nr:hypothetical protein [Pseudomonas sp. MF4836]
MKTMIFIPVLLSSLLVALAPFFAASENARCAEKDSGPSDKKLPKGMQKFITIYCRIVGSRSLLIVHLFATKNMQSSISR